MQHAVFYIYSSNIAPFLLWEVASLQGSAEEGFYRPSDKGIVFVDPESYADSKAIVAMLDQALSFARSMSIK